MKRMLLVACAVLMTASIAQAEIQGIWSSGQAVSGYPTYTKYILTLNPTAGEVIGGIDIAINAPVGTFNRSSSQMFKTDKDQYSDFLLTRSHVVAVYDPINDEYNDVTYTDLNVVDSSTTNAANLLRGAFARYSGDGLLYSSGWNSAFELLEVVVKNANTPANFTYNLSSLVAGTVPQISTVQGVKMNINFAPVPEPGTLALLASGLVGLLAYAWRKRK